MSQTAMKGLVAGLVCLSTVQLSACNLVSRKEVAARIESRLEDYNSEVRSVTYLRSTLGCLFAVVELKDQVYEEFLRNIETEKTRATKSVKIVHVMSLHALSESASIDPDAIDSLSAILGDVKQCAPKQIFDEVAYSTDGILVLDTANSSAMLIESADKKRVFYFAGGI